MPEGVETARSLLFLLSHLKREGKYPYLVNVLKLSNQFPAVNIQALFPALDLPLLDVFTKGKEYYLVFPNSAHPDPRERIVVRAHHGMTGYWSFDHPQTLNNYHFRLDFAWNLESYRAAQLPDMYLYYYNERFGQFEILPTLQSAQDSLLRLGMDFLGQNPPTLLDWQFAWGQLSANKLLRSILMDQTELCCGIGNYLLAEILYYARFHPDIKVGQLSATEAENLFHIISAVMQGHFQKTLAKVIYKKTISPEGHPIEYLTRGGRKIWYVPSLQLSRG